ncbi:MAG: CoA transferase [Proteobacteria bacterium]|nr:CoA transferase [Pseudomonadota bacterium]
MQGIRILEVAQFTFTPAAAGILADWGADVIKVEHPVAGDAQRGLQLPDGSAGDGGSFVPIMEHPNRGKRSIGLALDQPQGIEILYELAKDSDVFLTNFMPDARQKLKIDVEDLRGVNPEIIYVRGTAHGSKGPEAWKGGYDGSVFWNRMGPAWATTPPDAPRTIGMPTGAFGDSMGAMTIAGGISGALFARERSGEPSLIDVSLMSVGAWAMAYGVNIALTIGEVRPPPPLSASGIAAMNPVAGNFETSDGRWINLTMLQPGRYWADFCRHLEREDLIEDERFSTVENLMANAAEGAAIVAEEFRKRPFSEWMERLQSLEGQWAPVQTVAEVANDPQLRANGYIAPLKDADGRDRELVLNPVQFDETPPEITRAPLFAEHTDEILAELGRDTEQILQLKIDGVVT